VDINRTPILYHGPKSRDLAVQKSEEIGRPISDPIGDQGLKVDDSRLIVSRALVGGSGVGDRPPTVVLGPLDKATPEAADALLKTLEDLADAPLRIFLWADFLSDVSPTIRSRTLHHWSPGPYKISKSLRETCESVIKYSRDEELDGRLIEALLEALEKFDPEVFLDALVFCMAKEEEYPLGLWERVRPVLGARWLSSKSALIEALI
jgi:hypothetical protein